MDEHSIEVLVKQWRRSGDPQLTPLILRQGEASCEPLEGLAALPVARVAELSVLARKGDSRRVSAVIHEVQVLAKTQRVTILRPLFEALTSAAHDPRYASAALELLLVPGALEEPSAKAICLLIDCVAKHGDSSHAAGLRTLNGAGTVRLAKATAKNLEALQPSSTLTRAELERLEGRVPKPVVSEPAAPRGPTGEALLAAICAAPDDDRPRHVYADWLLERKDPRGEFIALQLQRANGGLTKTAAQREAALLTNHRKEWLGVLRFHLEMAGLKFERGFVGRCTFQSYVPPGMPHDLPLLRLIRDASAPNWNLVPDELCFLETLRNVKADALPSLVARGMLSRASELSLVLDEEPEVLETIQIPTLRKLAVSGRAPIQPETFLWILGAALTRPVVALELKQSVLPDDAQVFEALQSGPTALEKLVLVEQKRTFARKAGQWRVA